MNNGSNKDKKKEHKKLHLTLPKPGRAEDLALKCISQQTRQITEK